MFIFVASAKSGLEYDLGQGLLAQVKQWLERVLSSIAGQRVDPSPIGHFAEYFVLGGLLLNALSRMVSLPRAPWLSVAIAAAYAVTDELHQLFVPGRACDPADWIVDVIAASIAVAIAYAIAKSKAPRAAG